MKLNPCKCGSFFVVVAEFGAKSPPVYRAWCTVCNRGGPEAATREEAADRWNKERKS